MIDSEATFGPSREACGDHLVMPVGDMACGAMEGVASVTISDLDIDPF